jgi:serine/threonine-protein kinase
MARNEAYERVIHIADGGMGSVVLARDRRGQLVAIKTLRNDLVHDGSLRRMFLKEMRLAARIRHPNVTAVLASGVCAQGPFFAMEWVDGSSLRTLLRHVSPFRLPLAVSLRITRDVCAGLHAAHELRSDTGEPLGLVHRDVSPHNVLVSRSGVAKLIDFGVATTRLRTDADTTSSGILRGKIRYMAPEQAITGVVDRRADIFSVGAVLFEMITGSRPFDRANDVAVLQALAGPEGVDIPPGVPRAISAVLSRALAKHPSDRYLTVDDMARAVERAMDETGHYASADEVAYVVQRAVDVDAGPRRGGPVPAFTEERGGGENAFTRSACTTISRAAAPKAPTGAGAALTHRRASHSYRRHALAPRRGMPISSR